MSPSYSALDACSPSVSSTSQGTHPTATPPKKYQIILAFCLDNQIISAYNKTIKRDTENKEEPKMTYTMTYRHNEITLNTETGDITGNTYQIKQIIKDDLYATWDAARRVWHSDNLAETIEKYRDYLTRLYKLEAEIVEVAVEADTSTTETAVVETTSATKAITSQKLVNGEDGFYQVIHYTDGTSRKIFVG
jgi:hypothetical protein